MPILKKRQRKEQAVRCPLADRMCYCQHREHGNCKENHYYVVCMNVWNKVLNLT